MKRNIDLEGATNFRDLGGYETSNGAKIKKGLIFRSDHLSNLSSSDINIIKDLGIKTICDFRSDAEMIENPSLFNQDSYPKLLHIPIKTLGTQDLQELSSKENVTSEELANALQDHYVLYVNQHKEKYSQFLMNIAFGDIFIRFLLILKFLKSFNFFFLLTLSFIDITLSEKITSAFSTAFFGSL